MKATRNLESRTEKLGARTKSGCGANLELKPRYPLFGGWNYSFKVGWNGQLSSYLRSTKGQSDSYVLKVPFFEGPKQGEGVEYERVVTRIVLPEGATNVRFETDFPLVSHDLGTHRTFMDTIGRTTLVLTIDNVVDDLKDKEIIVSYIYLICLWGMNGMAY